MPYANHERTSAENDSVRGEREKEGDTNVYTDWYEIRITYRGYGFTGTFE